MIAQTMSQSKRASMLLSLQGISNHYHVAGLVMAQNSKGPKWYKCGGVQDDDEYRVN